MTLLSSGLRAFRILAGGLVLFLSGCATIPPPRAAWNLLAHAPSAGADRTAFNISVYNNVWSWVYRDYYDARFNGANWMEARKRHFSAAASATDDDALYAAINALLDELKDRHTHAADAQEFASLFQHINAVIGLRSEPVPQAADGRRRVVEVLPESAAANAGVQIGWWLIACNGRAPAEVLGPGKLRDGELVHCDFLEVNGTPRPLELVARRMSFPPYRSAREMGDHLLVLRFDTFDLPSAHWLRAQLVDHPSAKGVILDLRGNTGGHVFALASVVGDVFPSSMSLGEMVHRGKISRWHRSLPQNGGAHYAGPLAVVVSHDTASAAEIFAQLIQDYGRGYVIGSPTAGATLTSVFWPLAGGGKLQLSVYDYRSPKGRRLEGNGVMPDFILDPSDEGPAERSEDQVLKTAIDVLSNKETVRRGGVPKTP